MIEENSPVDRIYLAGFINKPKKLLNKELTKKVKNGIRKDIVLNKKSIIAQELNTFLLIRGDLDNSIEQFENLANLDNGNVFTAFQDYYKKNEKNQISALKSDLELKETSKIISDFLKIVDKSYVSDFSSKIDYIKNDLSHEFCILVCKTYVTMANLESSNQYRFYLSGQPIPFTGSKDNINFAELIDKLLIFNFFSIFTEPTYKKIEAIKGTLEELESSLMKMKAYKPTDIKLYRKVKLFMRILIAKLSSLQELEQLLFRLFNLYEIPKIALKKYDFNNGINSLNDVIDTQAKWITDTKVILHEVTEKIQSCQLSMREILDFIRSGIQKTDSKEEFRNSFLDLAKLSVNIFTDAEILKKWSDFFTADVPYFSFDTDIFKEKQDITNYNLKGDSIIAVRSMFKNYNLGTTTVYALRGITFDVKQGEFLAITGFSGAGKTTLLNCIAGLDSPDYGKVFFKGNDLHGMDDGFRSKVRLKDMGFIFQMYALLPHYNTRENVALPADIAGMSGDLKSKIEELLVGVGIDGQSNQFPNQLSGGQMQRVAIARALTNSPAVIFADEPTGDLDSITGKQVMDLLKKFHEETGTTIVVITHDPDVAAYATRELKMKDGVLV